MEVWINSWLFFLSKMINFSQPDTIDERAINKKKLTPFTISVSTAWIGTCHKWKSKIFFCFNDSSPGGEKKFKNSM